MSATFLELEENILKMMDNKQNLDKEIEKLSMDNRQELNELEEREKQVLREREKILLEKNKDDRIIRDLKKHTEGEGRSLEMFKMIRDLHCMSVIGEDYENSVIMGKKLKFKPTMEMIKELMDNLRKVEFDSLDYINELAEIADYDADDKFKKIVHMRKEYNKHEKQLDMKKNTENINNLKKEKAEERMHRVIVKGRNVMKQILVGKGQKKEMHSKKTNKAYDDLDIMSYND